MTDLTWLDEILSLFADRLLVKIVGKKEKPNLEPNIDYAIAEAKQAIASHINQLEVEARIDELQRMPKLVNNHNLDYTLQSEYAIDRIKVLKLAIENK